MLVQAALLGYSYDGSSSLPQKVVCCLFRKEVRCNVMISHSPASAKREKSEADNDASTKIARFPVARREMAWCGKVLNKLFGVTSLPFLLVHFDISWYCHQSIMSLSNIRQM